LNFVTYMAANRFFPSLGRLLLVACFMLTGLLASESHGLVKSGNLPVPGATVTASQPDKPDVKQVVTTTDDLGAYSFPELADGVWTITVRALGFVTQNREIGVTEGAPGPTWDLKYQTLEGIEHPQAETPVTPATPAPAAGTPAAPAAGTPAAPATATPPPAATAANPPAGRGRGAGRGANGAPSLNQALAGQQAGGFTRLNVGQTNEALSAPDMGNQNMGDLADQGADSYTINGSVSSGLGMAQPGGDWMAGGRGGPGGPGGFGGDMGGGMPGMGNPGDPNAQAGGLGGDTGGAGGRGGGGARGGGGGAPGVG
jgi:hypothetical protein